MIKPTGKSNPGCRSVPVSGRNPGFESEPPLLSNPNRASAPTCRRTPSQRGKSSKVKGKNYERFIARWYREHGHEAKRGFQSRGGTEQSDVVVPLMSIECKCMKVQPNIVKAMAQAVACAGDGDVPVLHFKVTNKGEFVVVRLADWAGFLESRQ